MLLLHRKNNLLRLQSEYTPAKPRLNEDEQWATFYEQYNLPLKNQQSKLLLPEVTKFNLGNFSKNPSKEKPQKKIIIDTIAKDQGNILEEILRYLEDPNVEIDISDYKTKSNLTESILQGPCDLQPRRLDCLKFISQTSSTDVSHISSTEINYQKISGFSEQSSAASSIDSEDDSTNTSTPEIEDMELSSKGKDEVFELLSKETEDSEGESDSDSDSDSSSSVSEVYISDEMQDVEVIEISSSSKEIVDVSSSDSSDSEDHMDEGLFNLLGASAFVGKKPEVEVLSSEIHEVTSEIPLQEPCPKTRTQPQSKQELLPAMGSVEFISREISMILDQMMPLNLYDAVWRHTHLHQHSTLPVWDRMPICHIPISGHQLGADQNLVRAFDAFRPLLPSISTFYVDVQVKAAAELSVKLGRYVHPGKAIEASKQIVVPKKLFGVVPRYCYRHASYL
ncbi:hypothetical protein DSO57_1024792 [Entomophthora muscae]|uniref:Uncharacterized protein n=1 Tax=Entomophthora muscae TaxID=34485 RepID=A0ACC2T2J6_9FUNG|nr:hypothetical protein DSO57_1024792 [Entomophthora muscae]